MVTEVKCIFCLKENQKASEEHIFPDSLGGQLVTYDVCKECNDILGQKVDSPLVNSGLMQFARFTKRLKGKKGKIPNPIGKGKYKDDPNTTLHYNFTDDGKPHSLYVVPRVKVEDNNYEISVDASEPNRLVKDVNKILARNGLEPKTQEEILSTAKYVKIDNPTMEINMSFDMSSYKKAIIKIIYEMTYYWLGEKYLTDSMGSKIRDYILSDELEVDGLFGKVGLVTENNIGLNFLADSDSHIALLKRNGNKLYCYVNIFNNFDGGFIVTEHANLYSKIEDRFLKNDVVKKEIRESTLLKEIVKITNETAE
ncbi:HNH endonuclease [Metabacillus fastidiosus]|uniref:HNH endonuclease n=1 Tax=Metabacillus fastidiosus TaxID=1458 RepID=UPI003D2B69B4